MKKLALTMLLLLGVVGMAGTAHALVYGASYNAIGGGVLSFTDPLNVSPLPLISNNTSAAGANIKPPASGGASTSDVGTGPRDAGIAIAPNSTWGAATAPTNNSFALGVLPSPVLIGQNGNYSYGDSVIPNVQDVQGFTNAYEIAEGNIGFAGSAEARGDNSSVTQFNYTFDVLDTNTINFSFLSAPYMEVYLSNQAKPFVSKAEANMGLSVNIVKFVGGLSTQVFSWAPDGLLGAITGGTEVSDPYSLNANLFALEPGDHWYFNQALASDPNASFYYEAYTNVLGSGTYQLQLKMSNNIALVGQPVPEPGTIMLLGAGLLGLAALRFRKKS